MLEDFYFKGEDPLKVLKSSTKSIVMILPYILLVIGMFVSIALTADDTIDEAGVWKKECQRYFFFKEPRIVYYRDYVPVVWCAIESQKIIQGLLPFDYKKDTKR